MSVPAFLDIQESDQVQELRAFFKSRGAEITEELCDGGLAANLSAVIKVSEVIWKDPSSETDGEAVFNSIISLIPYLPTDKLEEIVLSLCEKLSKPVPGEKAKNVVRVRVLSNLYHALDDRCPYRYNVYLAMVRVAGQAELIHYISPKIDELRKLAEIWDISTPQLQTLLRAMHEAFYENNQIEVATKAMVELLGTYTKENASQARDDAQKCIVTCLGDPSTYLMDHLLTLKPVKFLEGEPIHDLLTIFVSGKLKEYMEFCKTHEDYIKSVGLSHEQNLRKMRLLTFMQMGETQKEISFNTIQQEMLLDEDDVEGFIIEVLRTKAVRCKIDQTQSRVIVDSTTHRTFSKQQWQQLRDKLNLWQQNLDQAQANLQNVHTLQH